MPSLPVLRYLTARRPSYDALLVQFAKQGVINCDLDEDGEPLLVVKAKEGSSSSVVVPESSSSEAKSSSSKAKPTYSSSGEQPPVIDF